MLTAGLLGLAGVSALVVSLGEEALFASTRAEGQVPRTTRVVAEHLGEAGYRKATDLGHEATRLGAEVVGIRGTEVGQDDVSLILRSPDGRGARCHRVDFRPRRDPHWAVVGCPATEPLRFPAPRA
ncbi:hypothetical protein JOF53_001972 [Crossiella equi]|uniref:Uncharacterized protein n=1 Tax=Crossiella equi TaxID=130796 RepID=A0ABS5A956_9PSEU|nr:hypothetical protein [Crossiella equi]MBP2473100.1 hypothetical protein [Crossiella equi]